ncbi:MAG: c-type cytochrome biogenesis protein CcmI [Betaproteobacteria bacterium]|nr:MAG: c-type cytochrome biogenesis protein CcmI [Betaproteobacteria bacterium]
MNPVIVFLVIAVLAALVIALFLARSLWRDRRSDANADSSSQRNIEALQIELKELHRDRKLGLLTGEALAEAERELEVRVLRESALARSQDAAPGYRKTAVTTAILLPVFALGGYVAVGSPNALLPELVRPDAAKAQSQMDELFRMAEERLKATPDDAKGWALLARAQASVGQFDNAIRSYEKLVALTPNDADAWSDFADAAAGQAQGTMTGRPIELINKALAIDPKQPKALLLRGTYEIQKNDLVAAEKTFTLAKSLVDPTTGFAEIAENALKDIAQRSTGASATSPAVAAVPTASAPQSALATISVELTDAARTAAASNPSSSVFVIVRSAGAKGGPPLAARKVAVSALKEPIVLTASDAMIGGGGLAAGTKVDLLARLSISGQPTPQNGDWQSAVQSATLGSAPSVELKVTELITGK